MCSKKMYFYPCMNCNCKERKPYSRARIVQYRTNKKCLGLYVFQLFSHGLVNNCKTSLLNQNPNFQQNTEETN